MKVVECKQGSTEWSQARLGVITASDIDKLVSPTWKVRTGEGVRTYLHLKLAEKIMGYAGKTGATFVMDQGNVIEEIAIPFYSFTNDVEVRRVGICLTDDGRAGASPDGLVGDDGGVEVKSPQAPAMIEYILAGVVPPEYMPQVQMSLWVTKRVWWDFLAYHRYLKPLLIRVYPIPEAQAAIGNAIKAFTQEMDASLAKLGDLLQTGGRGE